MTNFFTHTDNILLDAIENHEENPSPDVWENLQSRLDKEDAITYKTRFIFWKRISLTLILLLLSLLIYDTGSVWINLKNVSKPKEIQQTENKNKFFSNAEINPSASVFKPKQEKGNAVSISGNVLELHVNKYNSRSASKAKTGNLKKETTDKTNTIWENIGIKKPSPGIETIPIFTHDNSPAANINTGKTNTELNSTATLNKLMLSDSLKNPAAHPKSSKYINSNPFKPNWKLTAMASTDWAHYNLENDETVNSNNQPDEKTQIEQREKHEPSFTAGLLVTYQFKKHWELQSGIQYSNTSISIAPQTIYATNSPGGIVGYKYNLSSGYTFVNPNFGLPAVLGDSISVTSAQHNLQSLILPVVLRYKIEKGKFSISPGLGISANFLTSTTINTEAQDNLHQETININKLQGTRSFYIGAISNIDIQYQLNKKWALNLMPGFNYALTPITKNNVVKTYPYSFSIGLGVTIKIND